MYGQLRRATEKLCDRYERIKTWKTSLHVRSYLVNMQAASKDVMFV